MIGTVTRTFMEINWGLHIMLLRHFQKGKSQAKMGRAHVAKQGGNGDGRVTYN
jgi:hypothetical protein